MITIRKSDDRGRARHGWLDSHHSFSFAEYYDPAHMGFGPLRVINEDRVQPNAGFGTHGHADMEIISYVISGRLEHRDSIGNGSVLEAGDVQRMTAGTGVRHSEMNPSPGETAHFLQIWILPQTRGLAPEYEERHFSRAAKRGRLCRIASGTPPADDATALTIHQDVELFASVLEAGEALDHRLGDDRQAWIQVISGRLQVNGIDLDAGDGAAITQADAVEILAHSTTEFLLFDLRTTQD